MSISTEARQALLTLAVVATGMFVVFNAAEYVVGARDRQVIRAHEQRRLWEQAEGYNFDALRAASQLDCLPRRSWLTCSGTIFDVDRNVLRFGYVCHEDGCAWVVSP